MSYEISNCNLSVGRMNKLHLNCSSTPTSMDSTIWSGGFYTKLLFIQILLYLQPYLFSFRPGAKCKGVPENAKIRYEMVIRATVLGDEW